MQLWNALCGRHQLNLPLALVPTITLLALLPLGAAPARASSAAAQAAGPVVAQTVPLGVNIEKDAMFVDAVKGVGGWMDNTSAQSVPTDSNGWPLADAVLVIKYDTFVRGEDPAPPSYSGFAGTYRLSFLGQALLSPYNATFTVANQAYDPATNTTTADIVVPQPGPGGVQLNIWFHNTATNTFQGHTEHPAGGVLNVKLISPGYAPDTTQLFTDVYLNELKDFSVLRTMDIQLTNGDLTTRNWADRHLPTAALQAPLSVEYLVQLADQSHKDLWLNVPINATDDYVTQLAHFLKDGETLNGVFYPGLDPSLHLYLEYSNEVWNGAFTQYAANAAAATADPDPNLVLGLNLTDPYKSVFLDNQTRLLGRKYAKRTIQIANIISSVLGPGSLNTRVRPILAWQFNNYVFPDMLAFVTREFGGPPSQFVYGLAEAPYFGVANTYADTLDDLFPALTAGIDGYALSLAQFRSLATFYGLQGMSYEGGFGMTGTANEANIMLANHGLKPDPANVGSYLPDPRMNDLMVHYFNTWFGSGLDLMNYFNLSGLWSQYGWWGLTEDPFVPSVKNLAVHQAITSAAPAVNVGTVLPAPGASLTLPAVSFTDDDFHRYGDFSPAAAGSTLPVYSPAAGDYSMYDYLLRAPAAGTYRVLLNVAQAQANTTFPAVPGRQTTVDVLLDNRLLGTVALADGSATAPVSVTLPAGLHTLRLTNAQFTEPTAGDHSINPCPYATLQSLTFANATPATDVTSLVGLRFSGLRFDRAHGLFHQTATLTNIGSDALAGPLYLVLDGLTPGVGLSDSAGKTADTSPTGSPYVSSAAGLAPSASVSLDLAFYNPHRYALAYTPRVLAGPGTP